MDAILKPYLTRYGLVGHVRNGTNSGNQLMYHAEVYHLIKDDYGIAQAVTFWSPAFECEIPSGSGRWYRTPAKEYGHQSFDDLFGVSTVHYTIAQNILKHLRRNWGFYPTTPNPNKKWSKSWFKFYGQIFLWRRLDFIAHLKYCAGERVNLLERLVWNISMRLGKRDTIDGFRIGYFKAKARGGIHYLDYLDRVEVKYGSVSQMRAGYFRDGKAPSVLLCSF